MPIIAVWQCAPTVHDPQDNLRRLRGAAAAAAEQGAALLVTPELTLTGYDVGELASPAGHLDAILKVAAEAGVALVVGLAELGPSGAGTNTSVVVSSSGELLTRYDKAHLFGAVDRSRFTTGDQPFALTEVAGLRVATMICYDVEFPEPVRAAALAGADLIAVPTANMDPFEIVCDTVVPCRAWENQVWIAYANHCGRERDTTYIGRSLLVGPSGRPAAQAGDGEEIITASVDTSSLAEARRANPYLQDRRPRLYGSLAEAAR